MGFAFGKSATLSYFKLSIS